MTKINSIDEKIKRSREIIDQIIIEVKDVPIQEHEEPFRSWLSKNQIILQDIEKLRNDSNERSKISAFLLESQYVEFELISLLQELRILINTDLQTIRFEGEKNDNELYKLSLGKLYEELSQYKANFLKNLVSLVKILNEKRIRFAHYLFTSIKSIDEIIKEAKEGLAHNDKVIEELFSVFEYIKKNTWYGQMYERKRVKEFSNKKKT